MMSSIRAIPTWRGVYTPCYPATNGMMPRSVAITSYPKRPMTNLDVERATPKTAGRVLVAALELHGVERIFCVPGESYLEVLDALHDEGEIELIVAKHGAAAACMAEADGKLTGHPGICMVAGGSGAAHASIGLHIAQQDATPLILFVGQSNNRHTLPASGDLDYQAVFGSMAKLVIEVSQPDLMAAAIAQAFSVASSGRPGPVVVTLPEDLLCDSTTHRAYPEGAAPAPSLSNADLDTLDGLLKSARRPMVIVGGSGWTPQAAAQLTAFVTNWQLPVATTPGRQDLIDNNSALYIGHLGLGMNPLLKQRLANADVILTIGTRLEDVATGGHSLLDAPGSAQKLIYCYPSEGGWAPAYQAQLSLHFPPAVVTTAIARLAPPAECIWHAWTSEARAAFVTFGTLTSTGSATNGVDLAETMFHLSKTLPDDAIVAHGTGRYSISLHRYFRYKLPRTELTSSCGSMAYTLPAAVSAALRYVSRTVVCVVGDGNFMTCPQSLATAVEYGASLIVLVVNNGMYGTVRAQQEKRYPGRVTGAQLMVHDYVAVAKSFGATAERVTSRDAFPHAFDRAQTIGGVYVIELVLDTTGSPP